MSWVAVAVAGAAIVGGVVSKNASDNAIESQENAAQKASDQLNTSTGQAKQDLFNLFPAAQQNATQGYQGALDVFKQTAPQQAGMFQQGNVAAQNQLLAGMPQYQNAILGAPVDYSKFQTTQLQQPNFDYLNQQLSYLDPYAPTPQPEALPVIGGNQSAQVPTKQNVGALDYSRLLGGSGNGFFK